MTFFPPTLRNFQVLNFPRVCSAVIILISALVLIGWQFDISSLKNVLPHFTTMKANTAICFLAQGSALWFSQSRTRRRSRLIISGLAAFSSAVALLTLSEYAFGWNLGIDEMLFRDFRSSPPGRMAPGSAVGFVMFSVAFLMLDVSPRVSDSLSLCMAFGVLIAFVGYLYGMQSLYTAGAYVSLALQTVVGFLLLSLGLLSARPNSLLTRLLSGPEAERRSTLYLFLGAIVLPLFLGWVSVNGHRIGWYSQDFSFAFFTMLLVVSLVMLVSWAEWSHLAATGEMAESEERFRQLFEDAPVAYHETDRNGTIRRVNAAECSLLELDAGSIIGRHVSEFASPEQRQQIHDSIGRKLAGIEPLLVAEQEFVRPDERRLTMEVHEKLICDTGGAVLGLRTTLLDVTDRKLLEAQLLQAQKMEAVGRLAGGVAHDFNNLLTIILGHSAALESKLAPEDRLHKRVIEIQNAGERAAALTMQLLAFSRKQVLQPVLLNLNGVISGIESMLRRLIGEDIQVDVVLDPALADVVADRTQLEQVIMNLSINARDAMPEGGMLNIETRNAVLDERGGRLHSVAPGRFAVLAVSDTGTGMSDQIKAKIFEPFFTTKEVGKGTGLGLATVYGIVQQSCGAVVVYSEVGRGSTFHVYLPVAADSAAPLIQELPPSEFTTGSGTLLVVEDEFEVRALAAEFLSEAGFHVLQAATGGEALQLVEEYQGAIRLVITDVVMPGMSGPDLVTALRRRLPGLKALFTSGYTDHALLRRGTLTAGVNFLQKPYTGKTLLRGVGALLQNSERVQEGSDEYFPGG
ncbi:MAG TPA: ATP-binding protein [Bryobacteraceae bacterium]|nr:ATP-binding protein [Bryobacteraceae bacterium]